MTRDMIKRLPPRALASTLLAALAFACADPVSPNTDLGLRVWADVTPSVVRIADPDAAVRIRVYAENPTDSELRIRSGGPPFVFAGDPLETHGLSYGFRLAHGSNPFTAGPTTDWGWDSVYVFKPFEANYVEQTITLRSWNSNGAPPDTGVYRVRSFYNAREGASARFRIVR